MSETGLQALKFGLVGIANTALGLSVILVCMYVFGFPPVIANVIGYAAGLCLSFYGNSRWTFRHGTSRHSGVRFLLAFGISYLANLAILLGALRLGLSPLVAQILAVMTYTAIFFVLSKFFVFPEPSER